jgi:hypothetical protein
MEYRVDLFNRWVIFSCLPQITNFARIRHVLIVYVLANY